LSLVLEKEFRFLRAPFGKINYGQMLKVYYISHESAWLPFFRGITPGQLVFYITPIVQR